MSDTDADATHAHVAAPDAPADAPSIPGLRVLRVLGEGGMGRVYLAEQTATKRQVALKVVLKSNLPDTELRRFLLEAEAIASITHPHVVAVYESGEHAGKPYLVLEYAPNGSLADRLKAAGKFAPSEAASLVERIARGVAAAHLRGIVHRDLKPGNVLLDADGQPKVTDFGLAKRAGDATLTQSGALMGTPAYMAPEQADRDGRAVGPATDVYALGTILFECLTGGRPFAADNVVNLLHALVHTPPPTLRSVDRTLPRDLETIVGKCLAKSPRERYADAGALADDLERWRNVEPITARPASGVEKAGKWARRNPVVAAMSLALLVGAAAMGWLAVRATEEAGRANAETGRANTALEDAQEQKRLAGLAAERADGEAQEAREQKAEAERQLERAEDLVTATRLDRAQQYWANKQGREALGMLDAVQWDHRERVEYRILSKVMREMGQHVLRGHTGVVLAVAWSPDGSRLATGSLDFTARIWDARTGAELTVLSGHKLPVTSVAWSPDGNRLATASWDRTIRVWDAGTGAKLVVLSGHTQMVQAVAWSPDGMRLATAAHDGTARVWDAHAGVEMKILRSADKYLRSVSWSADGSRLAFGSVSSLSVWDTQTCNIETKLDDHSEGHSVVTSPDGSRVATATSGGVLVRDAHTGGELLVLFGHTDHVTSVAWSPDGSRLATASQDSTARVWDARTGAEVPTFRGNGDTAGSVAWSPDGSRLAAGSFSARVWDAGSGDALFDLSSHEWGVGSVPWSPDGNRLATWADDKTMRIWDARTGRELNHVHVETRSFRRGGFP